VDSAKSGKWWLMKPYPSAKTSTRAPNLSAANIR
jgi:hypothetical protein